MTLPLAVLRPEPGNAATARRIEAAGAVAIRLPLFAVEPRPWAVPGDVAGYDGLLLTSANAVRHAGPGLDALRHLPVVAVGAATAAAAEGAGLRVADVGAGGVADVMARHRGRRLLHLAGEDRAGETGLSAVTVYASVAVPVEAARLLDCVALVHSPRAAARLAELAPDQARVAVAAISEAAADAAGAGWRALAVAPAPRDAALVDTALALSAGRFGR